jgi:glycosyltransferase involved in cell wall biosynthesis
VPEILNQLDAFIYATNHDTFGIAVIEAMSVGLPVFVNDWEVMIEITDQKEHGIFYETKNEQDLLNKFLNFLQNKKMHLDKAKSDAKWVEQRYGITHFLEGLNKNYTDLLS